MRTDKELQKDVMDELEWDPILTASEIGVSVKNGVVTLGGYVSSYAKKVAAENAAKRVKGVKAVAEDIEVRLGNDGQRNDTQIAEAALNALRWNTNIPDDKLKLKVENGWVTIEGAVDWQFQKDAAINAVRDLIGVKGVSNFIALVPRVSIPAIEKNIKQALHRSAEVEAKNIDIKAVGSKVIVKGKARSWSERQEVARAVWSSPGVIEVEDDIFIEE